MSDKQKAVCVEANVTRVYNKIQSVWELLPDVFFAAELEKLCGFKPSPQHRSLVAFALSGVCHCRQVSRGQRWAWKKP